MFAIDLERMATRSLTLQTSWRYHLHLAADEGRGDDAETCAQVEALFAGLDWRKVKAIEARRPAAAEWLAGRIFRALQRVAGDLASLPATIDLSAIPEDLRAAVAALLRKVDELVEINRRQESLIAELNHLVHGKRSEKLAEEQAIDAPLARL